MPSANQMGTQIQVRLQKDFGLILILYQLQNNVIIIILLDMYVNCMQLATSEFKLNYIYLSMMQL